MTLQTRRHVIIGTSLLVLTTLHFTTPPTWHDLHNLLFKITFVPLILAALWFDVRQAMIWAGLTTGAYLVHVFGQLHHAQPLWAWVGDIGLYNVVTFTTAILTQRRSEALTRAENQAAELEENARALLHAEETLRRNERLRAVGELAAGMAHEIRNPLGGIRGAAEVLRSPSTSPAAREEFGELLEHEIARLDRVVGNFLEFARPPTGETDARADVASVVRAVLLLVGPQARHANVETAADVSANTMAAADADLVRQIVLNVVLNALQAQPNGGRIDIRARALGDVITIDIIDSGAGVPAALRERIFDPYVTGRSEGTGLGLPVAARIAENLGGALALEHTGPRGATFRLTLPAA